MTVLARERLGGGVLLLMCDVCGLQSGWRPIKRAIESFVEKHKHCFAHGEAIAEDSVRSHRKHIEALGWCEHCRKRVAPSGAFLCDDCRQRTWSCSQCGQPQPYGPCETCAACVWGPKGHPVDAPVRAEEWAWSQGEKTPPMSAAHRRMTLDETEHLRGRGPCDVSAWQLHCEMRRPLPPRGKRKKRSYGLAHG